MLTQALWVSGSPKSPLCLWGELFTDLSATIGSSKISYVCSNSPLLGCVRKTRDYKRESLRTGWLWKYKSRITWEALKVKNLSCNWSITDHFKTPKSLGLDRIDFRVLLQHVQKCVANSYWPWLANRLSHLYFENKKAINCACASIQSLTCKAYHSCT